MYIISIFYFSENATFMLKLNYSKILIHFVEGIGKILLAEMNVPAFHWSNVTPMKSRNVYFSELIKY